MNSLLTALCLLLSLPAAAAIKTWDGSSSGNWATGANWSGGTAPADGDELVFPTGAARLVTTNNFSPNRNFAGVTFLASSYLLRGNPVIATNGVVCGQASGTVRIEAALGVVFKPVLTVSNAAASLLLRGTNLTLLNTVTIGGNGVTEIHNPIAGSGGLTKNGTNTLLLAGNVANTYAGVTTVNAGLLLLSKTNANAIPGNLTLGDGNGGADADVVRLLRGEQIADSAAVTVNASGWLDGSPIPGGPGGSEHLNSLTLNNGAHVTGPGSGTLGVAGTLTCNGDAKSVIDGGGYVGPGSGLFTINVTGSGAGANLELQTATSATGLTKTGPGWLRIATSSSVAGNFNITQGILDAAHVNALGSSGYSNYVAAGATLLLSGYSVSGEPIQLNGQGVAGTQGALRATGAGSNIVWGGAVTLTSDSTINVSGGGPFTPDTTLSVTGTVAGVGRLTKDGEGTLRFAGASANTYSGGTLIRDGYLDLMKSSGVTALPGNVVIGDGQAGTSPDLHLSAAHQIADGYDVTITNGMFDLNTFSETIGTLNGGGSVVLGSGGALTVSPGPGVTCAFGGLITSAGTLRKDGPGTLILTGTNTFTGPSTIIAGTLRVDGSSVLSRVELDDSGQLIGSGAVGNISTKYGTIAPGASPGLLTCSNYFCVYSQTVTNVFELNGTTPGTGHDQLNIRGTVWLNNSILKASLGFVSSRSNQFVILNNDGTDAVTGTFNGLPQDATLTIGSEQFRISYTGGTGNDVVLTQITGAIRPTLTIERIAPTTVRLLWPTNNAAGFGLQSNTNLATTNWAAVSPAPVVVGVNHVVTNAVNPTRKFYRLFKP